MAGRAVVVFDFDRTIIDGDSDNWVVVQMGLTELFRQLRPNLPWTSLMDHMMKELHLQGKSIQEIAECLRGVPIHPRIISAIKSAHALGCDLKILSDANQFFIETILEHHGLLGCFSEIITNPTMVDEEGRLRIIPYQDFNSTPHGCSLCPLNLCKGLVIERIQASASEGGRKRFIYLGDGRGDYCPTLKLKEGDHVMPRQNFPLLQLICSNRLLIKAEVHEWADGEELGSILVHLINSLSMEVCCSINQLNPFDCKLHKLAVPIHQAHPHSRPVPK